MEIVQIDRRAPVREGGTVIEIGGAVPRTIYLEANPESPDVPDIELAPNRYSGISLDRRAGDGISQLRSGVLVAFPVRICSSREASRDEFWAYDEVLEVLAFFSDILVFLDPCDINGIARSAWALEGKCNRVSRRRRGRTSR